jgi:hypothetical protein
MSEVGMTTGLRRECRAGPSARSRSVAQVRRPGLGIRSFPVFRRCILLSLPLLAALAGCNRVHPLAAKDVEKSGIWAAPIRGAEYVRSISPIPGSSNVLGWASGSPLVTIISAEGSIVVQQSLSDSVEKVVNVDDKHLLIYFQDRPVGGQPAYEAVSPEVFLLPDKFVELPQFHDFEVAQDVGCRLFLNDQDPPTWLADEADYQLSPRAGLRFADLCDSSNDTPEIKTVSGFAANLKVESISREQDSDVLFILTNSSTEKTKSLWSWNFDRPTSRPQLEFSGHVVATIPIGHFLWIVDDEGSGEGEPYRVSVLDLTTHNTKRVIRFNIYQDTNRQDEPVHVIPAANRDFVWLWVEGSEQNQNFQPWGYRLLLASIAARVNEFETIVHGI